MTKLRELGIKKNLWNQFKYYVVIGGFAPIVCMDFL